MRWGAVAGIVGFLAVVEPTSGILQGFYTPLMTDIARHLGIHDADVNWFETAQPLASAPAVPLLASPGDIFGRKEMLLPSAIDTAAASWAVVFSGSFTTFLIARALLDSLTLGLAVLYLFFRHENKHKDQLIDFTVLCARAMWPAQLTAGLFGSRFWARRSR